jgi:hypothetical protein
MASDRSILERQIESVEVRPFTLDGFHRRREQKQRNRRIATAAVALTVAAAGIGGMARAFLSDPEPRPADQPSSRFVGTWTSTELDFPGISQTMTIRAAEGGALDIALHDDSSVACSDRQTRTNNVDTPSTLTGTGRLEDATTLVVPSPILACADGRGALIDVGFAEEEGRTPYTLVLDLPSDRLFDSLGVAWHRGATPENGTDTTTRSSERTGGTSGGPGTFAFLYGEVTFHAGRPWGDHAESYLDPRLFWLIGPDDASIEILANPVLPEGLCDDHPRVPASAEEVARAIRSNPDLQTTVPVAQRVGGIDALRLDVAAVPGASTCFGDLVPVVRVPNRVAWGNLVQDRLGRLYLVDLPGGSGRALAIWITAPEPAFERAVEAAAPVVDSFQFHTE